MDEISSYLIVQLYKVIYKSMYAKWGLQENCERLCEL